VLVAVPAVVRSGGGEAAAGSLATLGVSGEAASGTPPRALRLLELRERQGLDRPPVGVRSGRLADLPRVRERPPASLSIRALGVSASIRPVGVRNGQLEVPEDPSVVGWYRHGPSPGQAGSAVVVGHVDLDGRPGVFYRLRELEPGAVLRVRVPGRGVVSFRVAARRLYPKDELPARLVFASTGRPRLTLVTCGGDYDPARRRYEDNVVVFAVA
jgi:hypothetical protein